MQKSRRRKPKRKNISKNGGRPNRSESRNRKRKIVNRSLPLPIRQKSRSRQPKIKRKRRVIQPVKGSVIRTQSSMTMISMTMTQLNSSMISLA